MTNAQGTIRLKWRFKKEEIEVYEIDIGDLAVETATALIADVLQQNLWVINDKYYPGKKDMSYVG